MLHSFQHLLFQRRNFPLKIILYYLRISNNSYYIKSPFPISSMSTFSTLSSLPIQLQTFLLFLYHQVRFVLLKYSMEWDLPWCVFSPSRFTPLMLPLELSNAKSSSVNGGVLWLIPHAGILSSLSLYRSYICCHKHWVYMGNYPTVPRKFCSLQLFTTAGSYTF